MSTHPTATGTCRMAQGSQGFVHENITSEQLLTGKEQREGLIYTETAEHPGLAHLGSSLLLPMSGGQKEKTVGNFTWSSDWKMSYRQGWQNLRVK